MMSNSQTNTVWITNGKVNRKIKKTESIPDQWAKGRVNVHSVESKKLLSVKGKNNNPEKRKQTMLERYGTLNTEGQQAATNNYFSLKRQEKEKMPFSEKSSNLKRQHIFKEQSYCCVTCGNSQWLGEKIKLELHHIDGNKDNPARENLQLLCPNCHSFTDSWRRKNRADVV